MWVVWHISFKITPKMPWVWCDRGWTPKVTSYHSRYLIWNTRLKGFLYCLRHFTSKPWLNDKSSSSFSHKLLLIFRPVSVYVFIELCCLLCCRPRWNMQVTSEVTSAKCHPVTRPYLQLRTILTKLQNSFGGKKLFVCPTKESNHIIRQNTLLLSNEL